MKIDTICGICGDNIDKEYKYTTKNCNHTFHYECLMKSFLHNIDGRKCPYCRSKVERLPIINGLKTTYAKIHDMSTQSEEVLCNHILLKGKRKGQLCNKKCKLGYYYCKNHHNTGVPTP